MSHHIYTTRGIVLSTFPSREADRVVGVFTEELGLVYATARGARNISSRLAPSLSDKAIVRISLVRGKASWRITTVTLLNDLASALRGRGEALRAVSRISTLVRRLVRGEEKNELLYNTLERAVLSLVDEIGDEDLDAWELFVVAKTLFHLGYLSKEALPANLMETKEKRKFILNLVNSGIQASGLE